MKIHSCFSRTRVLYSLGLAAAVFAGAFAPASLRAQQDQAAQIATQGDLVNHGGVQPAQQSAQFQISDPNLGDIDLVSRTPRPKMFNFSTNQSFSYTTNAFLAQSNERDDFFWNGRFDASFVPYATRDFTPRLTFEQNFFTYTRFARLDFGSQTLQADFKYNLNRNGTWWVDGSYGVNRLYAPHGSAGEFYKYGLVNASINHTLLIPNTPVYLLCSAGAYDRHGQPSAFDRVAPYLAFSALYRPIEQVQVTAFLRPEYQFYTNDPLDSSRGDFNVGLGSGVAWTPNDHVTIGGSLNFVGNYSNAGGRSYNVFSPSVVVGAQISF
ncbi:MAG: hypothetical protein H0X40_16520 [Chthoniobacterales bacterium]|nr:hypothetical protein [Chthoniobacterales bacterium]